MVMHISKCHIPLQLKHRAEAARMHAGAQLREAALAEVSRRLRSMQLNEQTPAGSGANIQHQARRYATAALDLPRQASLLHSLCYVHSALSNPWCPSAHLPRNLSMWCRLTCTPTWSASITRCLPHMLGACSRPLAGRDTGRLQAAGCNCIMHSNDMPLQQPALDFMPQSMTILSLPTNEVSPASLPSLR